jgi:hypothetical protein
MAFRDHQVDIKRPCGLWVLISLGAIAATFLLASIINGWARTHNSPQEMRRTYGYDNDNLGDVLRSVQSLLDGNALIATRPKWPRDFPLRIRIWPSNITAPGAFLEVLTHDGQTIWTEDLGGSGRRVHNSIVWNDPTLSISLDHVSNNSLQLALRIVRRYSDGNIDSVSEALIVSLPIIVCDDASDVLQPVEDHALRELLATRTSLTLVERNGFLGLWFEMPAAEIPSDLALGLALVLVGRNGIIGQTSFLVDDRLRRHIGPSKVYLEFDRKVARGDLVEVRCLITGNIEQALCDFGRERYWSGSVEVPISIQQ